MKMSLSERERSSINKRGSTAVLLSMTFVVMMIAVAAAIVISRQMVVRSECIVFGEVWTKAVLSEYDTHLLEDYGIFAFQGPDSEVDEKLQYYLDYSAEGKLDASIVGITSELSGYEMNDPENFRRSLRKAMPAAVVDELVNGRGRKIREDAQTEDDESVDRYIDNKVVIDTLPSNGMGSTLDLSAISEVLKEKGFLGYLKDKAGGSVAELCFIRNKFNSHMAVTEGLDSYFRNEWEYILGGRMDDGENLKVSKRYLFLLRNALDLAYLYSDTEKQALITSVCEIISPGPGGLLLNLLINETWAATEADYDLKALLNNKRVPFIKTPDSWHTDLDAVLNDQEFAGDLNEEQKDLLEENSDEIEALNGMSNIGKELKDGQTYEDHLMLLMAVMNENTRLLRIMDLVQIDMKYRYYSDFDLHEYYCGVRFTIRANGKDYGFEDKYE